MYLFFMLVLLRRTSFLTTFYGLYFSSTCYTCYKFPSGPLRAASAYAAFQLTHTYNTHIWTIFSSLLICFLFIQKLIITWSQAGFHPPWQRGDYYQSTTLPPSHHGWIFNVSLVLFSLITFPKIGVLKVFCVTLMDFLPLIQQVKHFLKQGDLFIRSLALSL